jgi:alpha-beta hydrolase superfamily lysophospholipase
VRRTSLRELMSKRPIGVFNDAELHVWDGVWHAFFMDPDLPESQEVYAVVVKFFDRHLGEAAAGARRTR